MEPQQGRPYGRAGMVVRMLAVVAAVLMLAQCSSSPGGSSPGASSPGGGGAGVPAAAPWSKGTTPRTPAEQRQAPDAGAGVVKLTGYTADGEALSYRELRRIQANGKGTEGENDALVDPDTLRILTQWPLQNDGGTAVVNRPAGKVALAFAWPSSQGYSELILDLPGPGSYDLHELATTQTLADLERRMARVPDYQPSAETRREVEAARDAQERVSSLPQGRQRGVAAAQAWDAAAAASTLVAAELGSTFTGYDGGPPLWGFTLTDMRADNPDVRSAAELARQTDRPTAVRLVFDLERGVDAYREKVAEASRAGLVVVGQILDSTDMAEVDMDRWQRRVAEFVDGLPEVGVWEVGNEINGDWLGSQVSEKVDYAARYVREHTSARTMITLLWQLGEGKKDTSMFTWVDENLAPSTRALIDEVGLSLYPDTHPLGVSLDRVMLTLDREFASSRLSVTELGYRVPGTPHTWWWGSTDEQEAKRVIADYYGRAIRGYPYSSGGPYWWLFTQEAPQDSPLWSTFRTAMGESTT